MNVTLSGQPQLSGVNGMSECVWNERHEASHRKEACWKDDRWSHSFYTNMCVYFAKQGIETFFYQKGHRICPGRKPVCIHLKLFILLTVPLPPSRFSEAFFLLHLWLLLNVTGHPAKIAALVSHSWKPYQTHHTSPLARTRDPFLIPCLC